MQQGPTEVSQLMPTVRVVQHAGMSNNAPPRSGNDFHNMHKSTPSYEKHTLPLFVARYSKSLPVVVRVCRGFCGATEDTSISEGDQFSIHFVKHTTVVAVKCDNGTQYNVPLNSAIPFGIMYNPHNDQDRSLRGYSFSKVSDLVQASPLPRVVRARKAHTGSTPESSLVANELLLLRRVTKKLMGKKELKVHSLTTGLEKTLGEGVRGEFSTKPREVCLYLPELLKHVQDLFPHKAVLYGVASQSGVEAKLSASVVTLTHSSIETSLVATSANGPGSEDSRLVNIPVDLDILVRVVNSDEVESSKKLHDDTRYIYSHFDPTRLNHYVKSSVDSAHDTQSLLYTTVRWGHDTKGVELVQPASIPGVVPPNQSPPVPRARTRSMDGNEPSDLYHRIQRQHSSPMPMTGSHRQRPLPATPFGCSPPASSSPLSSSPLSSSPGATPPSSSSSSSSASSFPTQRMPTMEAITEEPQRAATTSAKRRTPGYSYVDAFPMRCTVEAPVAGADVLSAQNPDQAASSQTDGSAGAQVCERDLDSVISDLEQQFVSLGIEANTPSSFYTYDVPSNRPAYVQTQSRESSEGLIQERDISVPDIPGSLESSCEADVRRSRESLQSQESRASVDSAASQNVVESNRQQLRTLDCLQVG